jgi:hypothetical protein
MKALIAPLFVLALAATFAKVEIEIEGPDGWAAKLPTWRAPDSWVSHALLDGKPLTGYHAWVLLFVLLVFHLPFAFGARWSARAEARTLALMILFWTAEDFLWFVLNPHYGLAGFNPAKAWWHRPAWWGFLPRGYVIGLAAAIALYLWGSKGSGPAAGPDPSSP